MTVKGTPCAVSTFSQTGFNVITSKESLWTSVTSHQAHAQPPTLVILDREPQQPPERNVSICNYFLRKKPFLGTMLYGKWSPYLSISYLGTTFYWLVLSFFPTIYILHLWMIKWILLLGWTRYVRTWNNKGLIGPYCMNVSHSRLLNDGKTIEEFVSDDADVREESREKF